MGVEKGIDTIQTRFTENVDLLASKEVQPDYSRIAIICPTHNAADVLPRTLLQTDYWLSRSSLQNYDIFIALDNDGANSAGVVEKLEATTEVNRIGDGSVLQHGTSSSISIFNHRGERGKGHTLSALFQYLSNQKFYNPAWTKIIDSESRIYPKGCTAVQNPIDSMLNICTNSEGQSVVGAEQNMSQFRQGIPHFQEIGHPVIDYYNRGNALSSSNELFGGCIFGRTETVIPLLQTVYLFMPGCPSEDHMSTRF